ncbi:MAG: inositol monophosphatase [FCB group bacterium]|nr:inositol monophosphatase [FCB group bacterium]
MKWKNKELKSYLNFAMEWAKGAGDILYRGFNQTKQINYKGRIDPVTQFDLQSERFIISRIEKTFPEYSILAEEGDTIENNSSFCWVIDPLDGTVNYAHKIPIYTVSIALQYNRQTIVGVVYDPERDELFSAAKGLGAFLNRKRIKVSPQKKLERSLLATGFAYNIGTARKNNLGMFARMMKQAQAVRRLGSAALDLCWVATGRFDGFWEYYLHPWDTAAAILMVEEAGGKVSKISGGSYSIFDREILASNGHIHLAMREVLTRKIKKRK